MCDLDIDNNLKIQTWISNVKRKLKLREEVEADLNVWGGSLVQTEIRPQRLWDGRGQYGECGASGCAPGPALLLQTVPCCVMSAARWETETGLGADGHHGVEHRRKRRECRELFAELWWTNQVTTPNRKDDPRASRVWRGQCFGECCVGEGRPWTERGSNSGSWLPCPSTPSMLSLPRPPTFSKPQQSP